MIPYFLLIFIPFLCLFVAFRKRELNGKKFLVLGETDYIRDNNIAIPAYFFLYFMLLFLRHVDIGSDTITYKKRFLHYSAVQLKDVFAEDTEPMYSLFNWVVSRFTNNFQVFLLLVSLITIIPLVIFYASDRRYSYMKIILFSNLTPFIMFFSGIRQGIAMSLGIVAYLFVKKKKLIPFIVTVIVAMGFHHSAFVLFIMYPLYYATFKKKHLLFVIPSILFVYVFNAPIFNYITNFLSRFSDDYADVQTKSTGAYGSLALFVIFAAFSYFIPDESKIDREFIGLRNLLLFAVVLQCFAPLHSLAMRLNYYYILFIPMLIPKVFTVYRQAYKQVATWGYRILILFFTLMFFENLYTSSSSGISTLNTIPYKFFWQ